MKTKLSILAFVIFAGCTTKSIPLKNASQTNAIRIKNKKYTVLFPLNDLERLMENDFKKNRIDSPTYDVFKELTNHEIINEIIDLEQLHSQNSPISIILKEYDLEMIKGGYCSVLNDETNQFMNKVKLIEKNNEIKLLSSSNEVIYWNFYSFN